MHKLTNVDRLRRLHPWLIVAGAGYVVVTSVLGVMASYNPRGPASILIISAVLSVWGWVAQQVVLYGTLIVLVALRVNLAGAPNAGTVLLGISALAYPLAALTNLLLIAKIMRIVRRRQNHAVPLHP